MGRSSGYRPTKEQQADVQALRAELATLTGAEWQKATRIMSLITARLGKSKGPMGGAVQPRTCSFCGYYGHTKQFCVRRKEAVVRRKEAEAQAIVQEVQKDRARHAAQDRELARRKREQQEKGRVSQVALWERMGVEWDWHPAGLGAFPKWYLEERARVLPKCTEPTPECGSCR